MKIADGRIRIKIDVDGRELELTNKDLDQVEQKSHKAGSGIKKFAASLGLVAVGAVAFNTLKNSMDDAINRFDTLNKFPKVLQALGVSAEDSQRSMNRLADGIDGLPTKLNDIAQTAQRMYTSFGDMDKAADSAIALNNALLGSGSSAEQASQGTEMYLKALQTGRIDMNTWNTLSETMDVGLVKIAESFDFAGRTAKDDLYSALQDGTITLDQFNDALIEVGTGTGIMAKLARENTLGIATSFENLKTAAVRGLVEIIDAFNDLSKEVTGKEIAHNIDSLKRVVFTSFQAMAKVIRATTPVVVLFASGVKMAIPVVKALTPAIIGLMTAYGAYVAITKASTAIQVASAALKAATTTTVGASGAMASLTVVQRASTGAAKADMLIRALQNKQIGLGTVAIGLLTGKVSLATVAKMAMTTATTVLGNAIRFMLGPVGLAITGIGLLTAGTVALVKWFKKSSDGADEFDKKMEELDQKIDDLNKSIEENAKAHKESMQEIENTTRANHGLAESIDDLINKENLSAAEKETLKAHIDELNQSVGDLNLSFDEEAEKLNMSSDQIKARIDLMEEASKHTESIERQVELTKQRNEAEKELDEINELINENNIKHAEGTLSRKEKEEANAELIEREEELQATYDELVEQMDVVEEEVSSSFEKMVKMVEEGEVAQSEMVAVWVQNNEELVENMRESYQEIYEITTNAFEKISDESEASAEEMIENLKHNQEMMKEWGDNISELMGYASEHGHENFLHWLETLGPDSAAEVAVIADMSDKELKEFANLMEDGADVATDSFGKSLGEGMEESAELLEEYITSLPKTMQQQARDANFEKVGEEIVDGFVSSIIDGVPDAEDAGADLAKGAEDGARDASETKSPSRVFMRIGEDLIDGLVLGIDGGTSDVVKAINDVFKSIEIDTAKSFQAITKEFESSVRGIEKTFSILPKITGEIMSSTTKILTENSKRQQKVLERSDRDFDKSTNNKRSIFNRLQRIIRVSMSSVTRHMRSGTSRQVSLMRRHPSNLISPFNSLSSRFNGIGRSAMSGLTAGLNAGSGAAISAANRIANSVKSTMQSALKINSPSHVMRDEVGKWIPAGVAEGIKRYSNMIDGAIDSMYDNIVPHTAPEVAIATNMGANRMSGNDLKSDPISKNITNNNTPTIHIEKIENHSDSDIPQILEESAWILSREDKRL